MGNSTLKAIKVASTDSWFYVGDCGSLEMFYHFSVVVLVQLASGAIQLKHADKSLGNGFDISNVKIGLSVLPEGSKIFKSLPMNCLLQQNLGKSEEKFHYYSHSQDMANAFQLSAGLTPSFLSFVTLKNSLSGTYSRLNRADKKVSGATRVFYTHSRRDYLSKKCHLELNEEFVRDFQALGQTIKYPHLPDYWGNYKNFVTKYGTHYVTEVTYGASVSQYLSAESSQNYTERNFSARACIELAGPVHAGVLKASTCGGISRSEQNTAKQLEMSYNLVVLGGSDVTRNDVIRDQSPANIERLMNEGRKYESPILYKFKSTADMLMRQFSNTKFVSQAANLKSYVEGFVSYDCRYMKDKYLKIELQKFELDSKHLLYPNYVCTVAPEGCKSNSDCHWRGTCKCKGDSCVHYNHSVALSGRKKITASINKENQQGSVNEFCSYSFSNMKCLCERPSYASIRKVVWSSRQPGKMQRWFKKLKARVAWLWY